MKKLAFAFIVFAVLASACSPSKKDIALLEQIETLAVENPDSALVLLDSLPYSALQNREFRSRVTIAEAEAMYQNSEIMGKDSLFADALDFYRLREKDPRRYRAYFLSGYQHYLKKEYGEAIIDYLNAEHTAALTTDTLALGLVYRAMGDTFKKMEDYTSSLEFFQKSHDMFKIIDYADYYNYSRLDLASAYYNAFYNDECLNILTDSLFNYFNQVPMAQANIIRLKGQAYGAKQEYDSSFHYYTILQKLYPEYVIGQDWQNIGFASFNLGKVAETNLYNDSLLAYSPDEKSLERLVAICNKDYKEAYEILRGEFLNSNEYFKKITKNDMRGIIASYYILQTDKIAQDNENLKNDIYLVSAIISLILIFTILCFLFYRSKQQKIMNNNMGIIIDLTETLNNKDKLISELDVLNKRAYIFNLPKPFNALEILCNNYYSYENSPNKQRKAYSEIMKLIKKLQAGGSEIDDLIKFVNKNADNIFNKFCEDNSNMTELEYRLFLFLILGFSSTTLSFLLGLSVNQVYAKKTYIKNKIKKNKSSNTHLFLSYF